MKEFLGTPGPWKHTIINHHRAGVSGKRYHVFANIDDLEKRPRDDRFLYNQFLPDNAPADHHEEAEANSQLIGAALELLEALQILLWDYKNLIKNYSFQPSAIIAREAIKKALGLTTAELDDPDTDRIMPLELESGSDAALQNLIYDLEWIGDINIEMAIKSVEGKYLVFRNPDFYKDGDNAADQEAAAV